MTDFSSLGLSPATVKAVHDTGYTTPTPIQEQAIPVALAGRDVLGIAQTGTGKTAAFTLPMIDKLAAGRAKALMPRSLVIAPTRELADQVASSFEKYAKGTRLSWALLIGGVSFSDQETKLSRGVDVLIATPGRLLDFYERRKIMLLDVKMLVVDEADRMLDMGFIPDLERIFEITPKAKQTLFFSATMPPEITRLTTQFLKDPTRIEVSRPATTGENIKQYVIKIPLSDPKAKRMTLRALVEKAAPESGIVFCNRKTDVDIVAKSLRTHGFDASPIHGDLDQSMRTKTLEAFRKGELKLLVASDVAARGLDIPAVSHIFNYDVPHHADDYVHRIGRTGRAGRSGEAFMIVSPNDMRGYDKVIRLTKKEPEEMSVEVDWAEAAEGAARDRERHGASGRGRGRDGGSSSRPRDRDRERDRPRADHGERAALEPLVADPTARLVEAVSDGADQPLTPQEAAPRRSRARRERPSPAPTTAAFLEAPESQPLDFPVAERAPSGRKYGDRPARAERQAPERAASEPSAPERQTPERQTPERQTPERQTPERQTSERQPAPPRAAYGDRSSEREERAVVGFGSDTPAFLMRAAPLPPARKAAAAPVED